MATLRWICTLGRDCRGKEWGLGAEARIVAGRVLWAPFVSTTEVIEAGPMRCDVSLAVGLFDPLTLTGWRDAITFAANNFEPSDLDAERRAIALYALRKIERALALRPSLEEEETLAA